MSNQPEPDAPCCCGDVYDEHEGGAECCVDGCPCVHFELGDEEENGG